MEGNLDTLSIDACSGSGIVFSDSKSLKTSRWLQWGIEEGQVEQWYLVSPHTCAFYEPMVCAVIHTHKEWLS